MLTINIITLFPNLFDQHLKTLPFKKALELGVLKINIINLRDFGLGKHKKVDAKPFGGGVGMLIQMEPVYNALQSIDAIQSRKPNVQNIYMTPKGQRLNQQKVKELSQLKQINILCGRYEGVDARIEENFIDQTISIGDYVLSGGELPTLVTLEAICRLLPGVLEKEEAALIESFTKDTLEFPQYTRPEDFKGYKIPEILKSGHHKNIKDWKDENSPKINSE